MRRTPSLALTLILVASSALARVPTSPGNAWATSWYKSRYNWMNGLTP